MRALHLRVVVLCNLLILAASASAAYTGLSVTGVNTTVVLDPSHPNQTTPVLITRVWAYFTDPNDAVISWGGGVVFGSAGIYHISDSGTPGPGFLNHVNGGGLFPPESNGAASQADSFMTIGVTQLSQMPPNQGISLNSNAGNPRNIEAPIISLNAGGGVTTQATTSSGALNPITLAGFTGDGDSTLRVLLMQLVVPQQYWRVYVRLGLTIRVGSVTVTLPNNIASTSLEWNHLVTCCLADSCEQVLIFDCLDQGGTSGGLWPFNQTCGQACMPGDITGNYHVDVDDLLMVIQHWGSCFPNCWGECVANVNADCVVNVDDLLIVISHWSP